MAPSFGGKMKYSSVFNTSNVSVSDKLYIVAYFRIAWTQQPALESRISL